MKRISLLVFLVMMSLIFASVLRLDSTREHALVLDSEAGKALQINTELPAPTNVRVERISEDGIAQWFRITWDGVPGAVGYHVYAATAVPDSTQLVAFCDFIMDPSTGNGMWKYMYSFHPVFGDNYVINYSKNSPMFTPAMCKTLKLTKWREETTGVMEGTSYMVPNVGERDRFWCVTAYK